MAGGEENCNSGLEAWALWQSTQVAWRLLLSSAASRRVVKVVARRQRMTHFRDLSHDIGQSRRNIRTATVARHATLRYRIIRRSRRAPPAAAAAPAPPNHATCGTTRTNSLRRSDRGRHEHRVKPGWSQSDGCYW